MAGSDHYVVMRSDLRKPYDVHVGRRVSRAAAERLVRELNRRALARAPRDGVPPALYYLHRHASRREREC
jgi:hypothetical protein